MGKILLETNGNELKAEINCAGFELKVMLSSLLKSLSQSKETEMILLDALLTHTLNISSESRSCDDCKDENCKDRK